MPRRCLPSLALVLPLAAAVAYGDPPPLPPPPPRPPVVRPAPAPQSAADARTHAELLRSDTGAERSRAITALQFVEASKLRPLLAEAQALPGDARRWAGTLLDLARSSAEPRRSEFVRALLVQRAALRRAENAATQPVVPAPTLPPPPAEPAGRDPLASAVEIELRIVQARGAARALLLGPPAGSPSAGAKGARGTVGEDDLGRALAVGGADGSARLVASPSLALVGSGDTALALTRRRSYVERYDVAKDEAGRTIVSPVVDVVEEGLRIVVTPAAPAVRESPTLHVRVDLVELKEPLDEFDAPLTLPGTDRELTVRVSIPDVKSATLERVLTLPAGPWTVLGSLEPPVAPEDGTVVFLARTRAAR